MEKQFINIVKPYSDKLVKDLEERMAFATFTYQDLYELHERIIYRTAEVDRESWARNMMTLYKKWESNGKPKLEKESIIKKILKYL